jgi:hypothetical protein
MGSEGGWLLSHGDVTAKLSNGTNSLDKTTSFDRIMWMFNAQRRLCANPQNKKQLENCCDGAMRNNGPQGCMLDGGQSGRHRSWAPTSPPTFDFLGLSVQKYVIRLTFLTFSDRSGVRIIVTDVPYTHSSNMDFV